MKRFVVLVLLLLVGAEVFGQGSAPSPPQLWRRKGTADTSYIVIKTGDTVMVYDTAHYTKISIRGTNTSWLLPDSLVGTTVRLTDRVIAPTTQIGSNGSGGALVFDNFASSATFYSLIGNGLEEQSGYLTVTIGASVEGSEITDQSVAKADIDTTIANMVFAAIFKKTSAVADSAYMTKYYIDHNLFGYSVVGTPGAGQVPVFDGGTSSWGFGSGGSGSGDDGRFDMTLSNSDYVLGGTTYTGGYINTSTVWQRGDTGINLVKSGQHPGDTIIHRIDYARIQRNDGSRDIRVFRDSVGDDTLLIMQDSANFTKFMTSNSGGPKFNSNMSIAGDLYFYGGNRRIDSAFRIASRSGSQLYLDAANGLYVQGLGSALFADDLPTFFGSATNWTIRSDTLRGLGAQSKIFDVGRIKVDTVRTGQIRMQSNTLKFVSDTTNPTQDVAATLTRDTANDTTQLAISGKFKITADAGLTEFDSAVHHGRIRMYDGTNKSRIDSASSVLADTLKTLPGGFLTLQGATSGRVRHKSAATTTSYDLTWPSAQGAAGTVPQNDGSGGLTWSASAGGGNGSADFDSTTTLDSNILKGAGGTILLDVHKNATPSVVIGKGATMTSLIIGGNTSGMSSVDTSLLIYNSLDFGNGFGDYARLDSARVVNMIRLHRYYFTPTDFYGSPEAYLVRHVLTSWNEADTTSFPNNMYKRNTMFYAKDTNGSNTLPYNFTYVASQRDSLFSTVYSVQTGFTQVDSSSLYAAALYINETKVDSLNPQKASVGYATDSLDWSPNRALAPGDVVTVLLYLKLNPVGTSKKRVDIKDLYLNMRRY